MKTRAKYEYTKPYRYPTHTWSVVGARLGIHLHITDYTANSESLKLEPYSAGIEYHWRSPPTSMQNDPPSHDSCWLLKCPCWHDGSTTQATDKWVPAWLDAPHDHDGMFAMLEEEMRRVEGGGATSIVTALATAVREAEECEERNSERGGAEDSE